MGTAAMEKPQIGSLMSSRVEKDVDIKLKNSVLRRHRRKQEGWSPHLKMGLSCVMVGASIILITVGFLISRHERVKTITGQLKNLMKMEKGDSPEREMRNIESDICSIQSDSTDLDIMDTDRSSIIRREVFLISSEEDRR